MAPIFYRTPRIFSRKRRIANISLGGVRIYSDEDLKVGKRLELEFFLPDGNSIRALARVVWTETLPSDADAVYDIGLEFIELSEVAMNELKKVLEK